jgi:hypothetical protein
MVEEQPMSTAVKQESVANRTLLPMVLALAVLAVGAGRSQASLEELRTQMSQFARGLKMWLDKQGEPGIVPLTAFQNLPELGTNPSNGLAFLLAQELKNANVPVRRRANCGITGKLERYPAVGDIDKIEELKVVLEVVRGGKPVHKDKIVIGAEEAKEALQLIKGNDQVKNQGSRFFKGTCGVEILVNGKPRLAEVVEGMPFVVLKPNEEYTVRLFNQGEQETAVWVGIDGLSMFAFSEDREPDGKWRDYKVLVPGKKEGSAESAVPIAGWYFHSRENGSRKFRVTEYPESAAYLKEMSAGQLGMITLQFYESWPKGTRPLGVGTGLGAAFTQKWAHVERDIGKLKATITVRYDKK